MAWGDDEEMQQQGGCDELTGISWRERAELAAAEAVIFPWFSFFTVI